MTLLDIIWHDMTEYKTVWYTLWWPNMGLLDNASFIVDFPIRLSIFDGYFLLACWLSEGNMMYSLGQ